MARDVSYTFDPFELAAVDKDAVEDPQAVAEEVASFVLTQVLQDTASGMSAVYGTKWDGLSKKYKADKIAGGGQGIANLEFAGDLLSAVRTEVTRDNMVRIFVEDDQSDKADGHNNHSGESSLPLRRFIPGENEGFRSGIEKEIISIVKEAPRTRSLEQEALSELVDSGLSILLRGES